MLKMLKIMWRTGTQGLQVFKKLKESKISHSLLVLSLVLSVVFSVTVCIGVVQGATSNDSVTNETTVTTTATITATATTLTPTTTTTTTQLKSPTTSLPVTQTTPVTTTTPAEPPTTPPTISPTALPITPPTTSTKPTLLTNLILYLSVIALILVAAISLVAKSKKQTEPVIEKKLDSITAKLDKAFGVSHVGGRENNEDNFLIHKGKNFYLLAVADGLGGHRAGEVASRIAVETLKETFIGFERLDPFQVRSLIKKAHEKAHERIKREAKGEKEGMATTLTTAVIIGRKAIVGNTGDSRAYLIRGGTATRTKDHSLVQKLIDAGQITEKDAMKHPMKNIVEHTLGIDFKVDFYEWELKKGDILILSTDGLHDYVEERKIMEAAMLGEPERIARKLLEEALKVTKDNVTIVVYRVFKEFNFYLISSV